MWFLCSWLCSLYQLITGPQSDRPSSLLLLILWLFWGLFQSLPQMQEFLNVFFFFFFLSHCSTSHAGSCTERGQCPSHTDDWSVGNPEHPIGAWALLPTTAILGMPLDFPKLPHPLKEDDTNYTSPSSRNHCDNDNITRY